MLDILEREKETFVCDAFSDNTFDFHSNSKRTISLRLLVFISVLVCACNCDRKFDKRFWQQKGDLDIYPKREKMLNDLVNNHQLKGLTYKQVIDLLGKPERYSDEEPNTATYNIVTDYGLDIDPVYLKHLEVKFSSDSFVTDVNIREIKH